MSSVETGFLLISKAVARLEAGMFGGAVKRPELVNTAKRRYPRFFIGWGLHKEKAAGVVNAAIMSLTEAEHEDYKKRIWSALEQAKQDLKSMPRLISAAAAADWQRRMGVGHVNRPRTSGY
jgi:hypothetical protein